MKKYYTLDSEYTHIHEDATFVDNQATAEADGDYDEMYIEKWVAGEFGDCWTKYSKKPTATQLHNYAESKGIDFDCLTVSNPGTHPGGREWWIGISAHLMVPVWAEKTIDGNQSQ